jgi:molecular chaperone DnaK
MHSIPAIDFGTSNSSIAIMKNGKPVLIPQANGSYSIPSVVSFLGNGDFVVGEEARERRFSYPLSTIRDVKRLLGRRYSELKAEEYPFLLEKGEKGELLIRVEDRLITPQEVASFILRELVQQAEQYLGHKVSEVLLTIPVEFNFRQIAALQEAAEIAELKVIRMLRESSAASLYYGFQKLDEDRKLLVFDLGGGSLDISLMWIGDEVYESCSLIGDFGLGGREFNKKVLKYLLDKCKESEGVDLSLDPITFYRLETAAEQAKIDLTLRDTTEISLPFISVNGQIRELHMELKREELEQVVQPLLERSLRHVEEAIQNAAWEHSEIHEILLVGAATRMPFLQERLEQHLKRPVKRQEEADRVVALGAAIQGGVLMGEAGGTLLLSALPYEIGIAFGTDAPELLIPRNTIIPVCRSKVYTWDTSERKGELTLSILKKHHASRGEHWEILGVYSLPFISAVEVSLDLDANEQICLKVTEASKKKEVLSTRIFPPRLLSPEEIRRIKKDYLEFRWKKRRAWEEVQLRVAAKKILYHTAKQLPIYKNKMDAELCQRIQACSQKLQEEVDTRDSPAMEKSTRALQSLWQTAAWKLSQGPERKQSGEPFSPPITTLLGEAKQRLAKGKLESAIQHLLKRLNEKAYPETYTDLLLLSLRLETLRKNEHRRQVSDEQATLEFSQIAYALLDVLNGLRA